MSIEKSKPEQIVTVLRQIEVQIANGKTVPHAKKPDPHPDILPVAEGVLAALPEGEVVDNESKGKVKPR